VGPETGTQAAARGRAMLINWPGGPRGYGPYVWLSIVANLLAEAWVQRCGSPVFMFPMIWVRRHFPEVAEKLSFPRPLQSDTWGRDIVHCWPILTPCL